ncbi:hypothetical protein Y032_0192g1367 [Ancylostoma ceylanicum]|uniref:Reverse transcriptase domain-containing protein n=1 Tax=Ancylostoma ceylanicum TaxID=53326 RepID=A0A016SQM5_9BILA|nr:hypothetical protein Y032_0192g1367 [Ancylostoma ceylanicum]
MIDHTKLIAKLAHYGIRGQLLNRLTSYLQERHVTARVQNSFSMRHRLCRGVPQGGVFSPLLSLVFTAELPSFFRTHPDLEIQMFADDIKIYISHKPNEQSTASAAILLAI